MLDLKCLYSYLAFTPYISIKINCLYIISIATIVLVNYLLTALHINSLIKSK